MIIQMRKHYTIGRQLHIAPLAQFSHLASPFPV